MILAAWKCRDCGTVWLLEHEDHLSGCGVLLMCQHCAYTETVSVPA